MNAVLQCLLHLSSVHQLLQNSWWRDHMKQCPESPANCLLCQFAKVAQALEEGGSDRSVRPLMLKQVVGRVIPTFNTNQQQGVCVRSI